MVPIKLKFNMCDLTKEKDDVTGRYELETTGTLCSLLYDIGMYVDLLSYVLILKLIFRFAHYIF